MDVLNEKIKDIKAEKALKIRPENIRNGVNIFGITGNYAGTIPTGTVDITENGTVDITNYATANVNVVSENNANVKTKVDTNENGMALFKKIPELDLNGITSLNQFFTYAYNLEEVTLKNTNSIQYLGTTFLNCKKLVTAPNIEGDLLVIDNCFKGCESLLNVPVYSTAQISSYNNTFQDCKSLKNVPNFNFSGGNYFANTFNGCTSLENVHLFYIRNATNIQNMFANCPSLTNESLNNILIMLANAISYTGTKTLAYIGLSAEQASTCETLSNWANAQTAGWTTGY